MGEDGGRERLDVVGEDVVAPLERRQRLGCAKEHQPGARAGAELDPLIAAGGVADRDHVAAQRFRPLDSGEGRLRAAHAAHVGDRR